MNAIAQKIMETPMAPYVALLDGMTIEQKQILLMYVTESMRQPSKEAKSNEEIIREKFKDMKVPMELKKLRGCIKLTEEEMKDEHVRYILNR